MPQSNQSSRIRTWHSTEESVVGAVFKTTMCPHHGLMYDNNLVLSFNFDDFVWRGWESV